MTTETSPAVAEMAAIPDAISMDEIALVGLFSNAEGGRALIRSPQGDILVLNVGDTALGLTVVAVADDALHVSDPTGTLRQLTMPATP